MEEVVKLCWAEHVAQKARKEVEAKVREKAERRKIVEEEKKKKRILEYIQQLWDEMLEEDTALLESAKESQIMGPKCKEAPLENNADCWPSKKTKGKQLVRYHRDLKVKMRGANPYEKCVCTRQFCLVYNSR